jgi:ribose-phosphate pyrophosphokinase
MFRHRAVASLVLPASYASNITSFNEELPRQHKRQHQQQILNKSITQDIANKKLITSNNVPLQHSTIVATSPFDLVGQDPNIAIFSGTSNRELSEKVVQSLGRTLSNVESKKFSDGEISIVINESLRGKNVFIIQSCAHPVNDSVMELLLAIAAAKRAGAVTVTAVIPYFGYRLNRRGLPISTIHHSRFLWSAAADLAKMFLVMGVDKIISVDLQRPGQGHEACFFHTSLPAETITTHDLFVEHFHKILDVTRPLCIVSPNIEFVKKGKKFQQKLRALRKEQNIDCAAFLRSDSDLAYTRGAPIELQGDVRGKDVILIEDYIGNNHDFNLFFF